LFRRLANGGGGGGGGGEQQKEQNKGPERSIDENVKMLLSKDPNRPVEQVESIAIDLLKYVFPNATECGDALEKAGAWNSLIAAGSQHSKSDAVLGPILSLVEVFSSYVPFRPSLEKAGAVKLVTTVLETVQCDSAAMVRVTAGDSPSLVAATQIVKLLPLKP